MLYSAIAFLLSMMLTFFLGGLIGLFIRLVLGLLFLPLIAIFRNNKSNSIAITGGPWVLTIEFIANIFYGWFAIYIGVWVFRMLNVGIDFFYPLMVLCSFIWFDLSRIQKEQKRIKSLESKKFESGMPFEINKQDFSRLRIANFLSNNLNSRYTALFGKIAGAIIGGYNLIYSIN